MNVQQQSEQHPLMMLNIFKHTRSPDGSVTEAGLEGLAGIIYHTDSFVIADVFAEFLRLVKEEGFPIQVAAFQKARYH